MSRKTITNILTVHDRRSRTGLAQAAADHSAIDCRRCHGEGRFGDQLSLSAAIHGFHAHYLKGRTAEACLLCHPDPSGGNQTTAGLHQQFGMDCLSCHGPMEDFSLGLLKAALEDGKTQATHLMEGLIPQLVEPDALEPRQPWIQQPDCLGCHVDFAAPEKDQLFNTYTRDASALYRNRSDESGQIRCAACHGGPHRLYPARSGVQGSLDNRPPLQYQGNSLPIGSKGNCALCHTIEMEDEMHHSNMLRQPRSL